jgi:hypothetical protein
MTVFTGKQKVLRSQNLRVRISGDDKKLVGEMMHEDLISSESAFIRRLVYAEARRRGKLDVDERKVARA